MPTRIFDPRFVGIISIDVIKEKIVNPNVFPELWLEVPDSQYRLSYELRFNDIEKIVKLDMTISLRTKSKKKPIKIQKTSGEFTFGFLFGILHYDDFIKLDNEGEHIIDKHLEYNLVGVSYGTSRGLLLSRINGTIYRDTILPIMMPEDLVND